MRKALSKAMSFLLTVAMLIGLGNGSLTGLQAFAEESSTVESSIVNVYDATTFGEMLGTENADIVLWHDIDYSGSDLVSCNSIDLNG